MVIEKPDPTEKQIKEPEDHENVTSISTVPPASTAGKLFILPKFLTHLSPIALILLITLVGMSLYELLAHIISSKSNSLQGHLSNIFFASAIAASAGYFVFHRNRQHRYKSKKERYLRHQLEISLEEGKQAEATIQMLSSAVEQSPNSVIITNRDRIIEYVNSSFTRNTGYARSEVIGKSPSIIKSGGTPLSIYKSMLRTINAGKTWRGELKTRNKAGSLCWCQVTISPIKNKQGKTIKFLGIHTDITARHQAEQQAREHQAALAHMDRVCTVGEMATGLAHELNQPLTAIYAYAQACQRMLESGRQDSEKFAKAIEQTARRAEQAGSIVRHFRNFTQKKEITKRPIELNKLIREAITYLPPASSKITPIALDLLDEPLRIMADQVQIEQVIINLVRNSLDAIKPQNTGKITLVTRRINPTTIEVRVEDTGIGITEKEAENIFDAFYTSKQRGTGMGLVITRTIIEDHGGKLWLEESSKGGSVFAFTLPELNGRTS
ncbi:MAG: ATP-binding protein [Methylococcales bacterium]